MIKINQLLTLSQFVDQISEIKVDITSEDVYNVIISNLGYIQKYNEFLKQLLKKEMLIDEPKALYLGDDKISEFGTKIFDHEFSISQHTVEGVLFSDVIV